MSLYLRCYISLFWPCCFSQNQLYYCVPLTIYQSRQKKTRHGLHRLIRSALQILYRHPILPQCQLSTKVSSTRQKSLLLFTTAICLLYFMAMSAETEVGLRHFLLSFTTAICLLYFMAMSAEAEVGLQFKQINLSSLFIIVIIFSMIVYQPLCKCLTSFRSTAFYCK